MRSVKIRRSQLLSPFGIGAILDLSEEALMLLGLENWDVSQPELTLINDDRLAQRLKIKHFHQPITAIESALYSGDESGGTAKFARFPEWYFCPACREMLRVKPWDQKHPECSGKYKPCSSFKKKLVPVRFITACSNGHIDDFPWISWAHSSSEICEDPKMRLMQTSASGLAGLSVKCENCNKAKSLSSAAGSDGLKEFNCRGYRPWLGNSAEIFDNDCKEKQQMLQRGASNVYFSKIGTSILIPPFSTRLYKILEHRDFLLQKSVLGDVDGKVHPKLWEWAEAKYRINKTDLKAAYDSFKDVDEEQESQTISEDQFRYQEYEVFLGKDLGGSQDDLRLKNSEKNHLSPLVSEKISKLVLIEKLVETRCLTGFSRLDPNNKTAPLSYERGKWLPAIRGTGEGIFLELDNSQLEIWENNDRVKERITRVYNNMRNYGLATRRSGTDISARFILLHSLAHILSRRLTFECGYGSSSIKERIYESSEHSMHGILLFTSEVGGEGTLGGLVAMGEARKFEALLRSALNDSMFCSNDPLCGESKGQGPGSINQAACQGCLLLPETACEESNFFLDRLLLSGNSDDPGLGFFEELLN